MKKSTVIIGALLIANIIISSVLLTQFHTAFTANDGKSINLVDLKEGKQNPVVATYKGKEITQSDLWPYLNEIAAANNINSWDNFKSIPPKAIKLAVNNMVTDLALMNRAKKEKLDRSEDLQAIINKDTRRILKTSYLNKLSPTLVSDKQVHQEYDKLKASLEGKTEYRARHILLRSEKEANVIIKALKKEKRPFSELAKLFSLDKATAVRGGDLGYKLPGQLNPQFEKTISTLKVHEISKPFKTSLGWHVAVVDDRRPSKAMPFEQAAPIIRQKLERQAVNDYISKMLSDADIKMALTSDKADSEGTGNSTKDAG